MTATAIRPVSILRPFAIMAISAFVVGFLGVLAATGVAVLAQLGEFSHPGRTARAEAVEVVVSPAHSGAASSDWNFPKAI